MGEARLAYSDRGRGTLHDQSPDRWLTNSMLPAQPGSMGGKPVKKWTQINDYVSRVFASKSPKMALSPVRKATGLTGHGQNGLFYRLNVTKKGESTSSVEYSPIWENFLHVLECWSLARFYMWPNLNTYVRRIVSIYDCHLICTHMDYWTQSLFSSKKTISLLSPVGISEWTQVCK